MKIKDPYNPDAEIIEITPSIDILADDNRILYSIRLYDNGDLEVMTSNVCKYSGRLLDSPIIVRPRATNYVIISRPEWKNEDH